MIITSIVVIAVMLLVGVWAWVRLPADARIPTHWGADGQVDGWADKAVGLLLLPGIATLVAITFAIIPRVEPRRTNLERSATAYGAIWVGTMLLLGGLQLLVVGVAMGATVDMTRLVFVGTGALFIVIGNYLPKVRPNYLVGIRTPWTLTSDVAWAKTHRLGGRLFVIEGIGMVVLGVAGVTGLPLMVALIGGIAILLVVVFAYSYQVWKADPEKRTP